MNDISISIASCVSDYMIYSILSGCVAINLSQAGLEYVEIN